MAEQRSGPDPRAVAGVACRELLHMSKGELIARCSRLAAALAASEERAAAAEARVTADRAEALEEAADIIEDMRRDEHTWVRGALWNAIRKRMAAEIRGARTLQPDPRS